jgi:hypothetical protein
VLSVNDVVGPDDVIGLRAGIVVPVFVRKAVGMSLLNNRVEN